MGELWFVVQPCYCFNLIQHQESLFQMWLRSCPEICENYCHGHSVLRFSGGRALARDPQGRYDQHSASPALQNSEFLVQTFTRLKVLLFSYFLDFARYFRVPFLDLYHRNPYIFAKSMAVSIHFRHSLQRFGAGRWTINRGNASILKLRRYPGSNWLSLYGYWLV